MTDTNETPDRFHGRSLSGVLTALGSDTVQRLSVLCIEGLLERNDETEVRNRRQGAWLCNDLETAAAYGEVLRVCFPF